MSGKKGGGNRRGERNKSRQRRVPRSQERDTEVEMEEADTHGKRENEKENNVWESRCARFLTVSIVVGDFLLSLQNLKTQACKLL